MDWTNKAVLITGAVGTVGSTLLKQLVVRDVGKVIAFDNSESGVYELGERFASTQTVIPMVGDVRNRDSLMAGMQGVDIVFHGAALKHVGLGEMTPDEIVSTNVLGVQNMVHSARAANVNRVIFMSSDKAVNPTNVMGTSKLMGERLISAADVNQNHGPIFSSTRFGNVLGSSGSVVPTFMSQIRGGKRVMLTDVNMSRFVMTADEAVALLIEAAECAKGGEVFVTKMPVVRIEDLTRAVIDIFAPRVGCNPTDVEIQIVGKRPGEKLYEELLSSEEAGRVVETDDFFVVHSAIRPSGRLRPEYSANIGEYRSDTQTAMTLDEVRDYFISRKVIPDTA